MAGLVRFSGARGFRSRGQLKPREGGGGSSTVGREKRRPWLVAAASLSAGVSSIRLGDGKAVDREVGNVRCASSRGRRGPRAQGDGEGAHGTARRRRGGSAFNLDVRAVDGDAWRGRDALGRNRGGEGWGAARARRVADGGGERRHGENREGRWR